MNSSVLRSENIMILVTRCDKILRVLVKIRTDTTMGMK